MTQTATVTTVNIGHLEIEGLLLEDGSFGVAVPQICSIFQFDKIQASRDIKAILGNGFQFDKVRTTLHPKAVNVLQLSDFEKLLFELVLKGNQQAIEMSRDLVGLSLTQLFSDSFGIKFEQEERQKFLKSRQQGKLKRLLLTDGIKAYMQANGIKNGSKWYGGCTQNTYLALFGMTKTELIKSRDADDSKATPRDFMSYEELDSLANFENHAAILMIKQGLEPFTAVKQAKEFFS
jgi:hypothetical protein